MSTPDLVTIGVFARSSGITPSALRFYADCGVLVPAYVDDATGYRYYSRAQLDRATTLRRLREIDMPLDGVAEILDAPPDRAAALIDAHVDQLTERVESARRTAGTVRASLGRRSVPVATVRGPVLATAVDQVLTAVAADATHPVLTGVHVEATATELTLTATDRYRLATRTVTLDRPGSDWAGTVDGDDLRRVLAWTRRRPLVDLLADGAALTFAAGDDAHTCRLLPDTFPDHRALLAGLPLVRTRVVVGRAAFVRAVEALPGNRVLLDVTGDAVTVSAASGARGVVAASVRGPAVTLAFEITTLHPAIVTAAGPDLMLDITAPDQPVVVRSADDGDLTTLAMPVHHEGEPA